MNLITFLINYDYWGYYFHGVYYNVIFNGNNKASLNKVKSIKKDSYYKLYTLYKKSICHLLDSSYIIKCLYYDDTYFLNLGYHIEDEIIKSDF